MVNLSHEFNELCCKPRARCFKGLAILSLIYAMACGVMALMIPLVVKSHGGDEDAGIKDRVHQQLIWSLILGAVFAGVSVLNWVLFAAYRTKEGMRRSVLQEHVDAQELDD